MKIKNLIKRPLAAAAVLFAAFCFAAVSFFPELFMPAFAVKYVPSLDDGESLELSGRVYKAETKTYSVYMYLKNTKVTVQGNSLHAGKVLLVTDKETYEELGLKAGNKITVQGSYREFSVARNNGNYDEEAYYNSLGIFLKVQASSAEITGSFVNLPVQLMAGLRQRLTASFEEILGEDESALTGIFTAVVTGDRSSLTDGTKSLYSENGIAHILAVSGLHISLIGMGLFSFLKKRAGPYKSAVISSAVMVFYCIMCGLSVSALRAVIMFIIRMTAYFTGKTFDLLSALSLSAILILLSNPFYILNSGFILSFLAILSIGIVSRNAVKFLSPKRKAARTLVSGASVTLVSLPVVAGIYYCVPLYGILLNLIVIPLMSFVLGSGLAGAFAGLVSAALGRFLIGLGVFAVYIINLCCYLASKLPFSSICTGAQGKVKCILFYLLLAAAVVFMKMLNLRDAKEEARKADEEQRRAADAGALIKEGAAAALPPVKKEGAAGFSAGRRVRYCAVTVAFIMLFSMVCIHPGGSALEIIMFDVDQGDGILIRTPDNTVIMIDGGSTGVDDLWSYRLESALEYEGITTIDYSIITHPDSDHISGILELLEDESSPVRIKTLLIPYVSGSDNYTELVEAAQAASVSVINIYSGMSIKAGEVTLTCIHPDEGAVYEDTNDYSCTISLVYGDFAALFTGDISEEVELEILSEGSLEDDYDLLKVAHHGSKYSSCEEFLAAVGAETAIISAGVDNSYGHPASETLLRLENAGAEIYITAETGEIKITADENGEMDIWTKL